MESVVLKKNNIKTHSVFNMQCDIYYPFQATADLMAILEKKDSLQGKKIIMRSAQRLWQNIKIGFVTRR